MHKIAWLFWLGFFLILSCTRDAPYPVSAIKSGELMITDSLRIKTFNRPRLVANRGRDTLVFYDMLAHNISVLSQKGDTLSFFNRFGSGDQEHGRLRGVSLLSNGNLLLYATYDWWIYDLSGKFVRRGRVGPSGVIANPAPGLRASVLEHNDSTFLIYPGGINPTYPAGSQAFFEHVRFVSKLALDHNAYRTGIGFERESPYLEKYYYGGIPLIAAQGDQIFVKPVVGPRLYIYQSSDFAIKESFQIDGQPFPSGVPYTLDEQKRKQIAFQHWQQSVVYTHLLPSSKEGVWLQRKLPQGESIEPVKSIAAYYNQGMHGRRESQLVFFADNESLKYDIPSTWQLAGVLKNGAPILVSDLNEVENTLTVYFSRINFIRENGFVVE